MCCPYQRKADIDSIFNYYRIKQINPETYREYFDAILKQGVDVLYLCFSSGMSKTIQSAQMAISELQEEYPDRTILCLDTLCAAVGEGLFVMEAAKKQAQGMDIHELYSWLEAHRMNLCHWVTVDTFDHLKPDHVLRHDDRRRRDRHGLGGRRAADLQHLPRISGKKSQ